MSTQPRTDSWWHPTWRRLIGSTVVLFLVILAFLVGRVRAGADPGLARDAARATQVAPPATGSGVDPNDPFGPASGAQGTDPGASGATDGFGNAVPGDGGASGQGFDPGGGAQSLDPPSTHVS
jgi:hypothetical protein